MTDNDIIEVLDYVSVSFHNSHVFEFILTSDAQVLRKPYATGDSWVVKDTKTNAVYYISEGCTIQLLTKHKDNLMSDK